MPNTQGMLARLFVKPILPRRCSPPGWDGATSWGASGVFLQPLACDTTQKCLFQRGRGDERQPSRSSQSPQGLGICLPKQRAEQAADPGTGDVQTPARPLSSPPFFGTSGPGAAALPCVFTLSSLWGLLRASELASLPKKDTGLPEDEQMFLSPGRRGQPGVTRAQNKGNTQKGLPGKGLSQETGPTCEAQK